MADFPIQSRQASAAFTVAGKSHDFQILRQDYRDRCFMLLTHSGKIGQLMSIPLAAGAGTVPDIQRDADMHMLPPSHLDLVTVFGASTGARAEMSQLLAVQTAAVLYHHQPDNQRTLLMGVTLPGTDAYWDDDEHTFERAGFFVDILAFIATLS